MADRVKVFTVAHVPAKLYQAWLQHLRDFDTANPDCHFEIMMDAPPDMTVTEMVEMCRVNPALTFTKIFDRK